MFLLKMICFYFGFLRSIEDMMSKEELGCNLMGNIQNGELRKKFSNK
jgi:hypothetical protein